MSPGLLDTFGHAPDHCPDRAPFQHATAEFFRGKVLSLSDREVLCRGGRHRCVLSQAHWRTRAAGSYTRGVYKRAAARHTGKTGSSAREIVCTSRDCRRPTVNREVIPKERCLKFQERNELVVSGRTTFHVIRTEPALLLPGTSRQLGFPDIPDIIASMR